MEISEINYEGVVEPSYKKTTQSDANCAGYNRNMREGSALSNRSSKISGCSEKFKKSCAVYPSDTSKMTCLIHGNGYSLEQLKFLNNFGKTYAANSSFK